MLVLISFANAPIARKCTEFSDSSASDALRSYALLLGGDGDDDDEAEAEDDAPMPRACNLYCADGREITVRHSQDTSKHARGTEADMQAGMGNGKQVRDKRATSHIYKQSAPFVSVLRKT